MWGYSFVQIVIIFLFYHVILLFRTVRINFEYVLRLSFSLWILQVLMLCLVPQCFSRMLLVVGSSIVLADGAYVLASPRSFNIRLPDMEGEMDILTFSYGWCFWATIVAGELRFIFLWY